MRDTIIWRFPVDRLHLCKVVQPPVVPDGVRTACDFIECGATGDFLRGLIASVRASRATFVHSSHVVEKLYGTGCISYFSFQKLDAKEGIYLERRLALPPAWPKLTPRERQIWRLKAQGGTELEICRELRIARGTLRTHVHRLCGKLHVPQRDLITEAAHWDIYHTPRWA